MTSTLPVAQSRIPARLAAGNLIDATPDEIRALLDLVGGVKMIHVGPLTTDWKVFDANGGEVDISASTTAGLQEAVDAMSAPGTDPDYPLRILGAGVISPSTTVTFPPMTSQQVYMDAGIISFAMPDSSPGFVFQSMMNCDIYMLGKIVYSGTGPCIRFKAEGVVEAVTAITNSRIRFTTLDAIGNIPLGNDAIGIEIDRTNGPFLQNRLEVMKIDVVGDTEGGKALVIKDNASFSCIQNDIYIYDVRNANIGIEEGETNGTGILRNRYTVFQSATKGTNPVGLKLNGQQSEYTYDLTAATAGATGIQLGTDAESPSFRIYHNAAATPFTDNSTAKNATFHQDGAFTGLLQMNSYTVIGAPSASAFPRTWIWVSNEVGGATPAFSDGSDWRRSLDNAVIST